MSNIEIALVLYGVIFGYVFRGLVDYIKQILSERRGGEN